jgi:hypothetical protein
MDDEGPTARERHQLGGKKSSAEDSDVEVTSLVTITLWWNRFVSSSDISLLVKRLIMN